MSGRRSRRPPSLNLSFSSRETSPASTHSSSPEPETDEEMSSSQYHNKRPLGVAYPTGPYCVKRPSLAEVLSNTAPPPYTLSAFMAYLSQNHCLETLEFTMDAGRYRKHFNSLHLASGAPPTPDSDGCAFVRMLWQKLLDAYIVPNGPREVNLPCGVRNLLLSTPNHRTPPPPETLDSAVNITYELMQESVLMPFLSDCQQPATCDNACSWDASQSDENLYMRGSLDERLLRRKREPSPPGPRMDFVSNSYPHNPHGNPPGHFRSRTTSPFSPALGWHRHSTHVSPNSWTSGCGEGMMVNDSGSSTPSSGTPMTPPSTPPTSEAQLPGSNHSSPKSKTVDRAEKSWKKMTGNLGKQFGWKKKGPHGAHIFGEGGSF